MHGEKIENLFDHTHTNRIFLGALLFYYSFLKFSRNNDLSGTMKLWNDWNGMITINFLNVIDVYYRTIYIEIIGTERYNLKYIYRDRQN